ncbi:Mov34/MPN/PAD-1 family protein [Bacillus sp. SCS-151]|uniref:Mov34/MPN/PAD-1 family protein n=1 Tax=Nanhaiella sioensis TaxID=3115293 RepID=UPI00397C7182
MNLGIYQLFWRLSDYISNKEAHPYNIVASKDGKLYEIRNSLLGTIVTPAKEEQLRRIEQVPKGFQMKLPRIPGYLLQQIISFFRAYCNENLDHEVMLQLFWHNNGYFVVDCPTQEVSKARVSAQLDNEAPDLTEVMQVHSHNSMEAYFSETDNNDEQQFLLYGVVGRLDQQEPDIKIRVGVNGTFYRLSLDYIFDTTFLDVSQNVPYPEEWTKRVSII